MFSSSLPQVWSSSHQCGKLPKLPPLRLAVLLLMLPVVRLPHPCHHLSKRGIHQISASSYIRWILEWSGSSTKYLVWHRIWLSISITWTSVHPFLRSLSPLVPSSIFRKVLLPLYIITVFFTAYIGNNVRFRCERGLAMLLGVVLHFLFLISFLF